MVVFDAFPTEENLPYLRACDPSLYHLFQRVTLPFKSSLTGGSPQLVYV
jgi:hypothetical protein